MELKKTDEANLEKRKGIFFQLGLVIALSLILIAFEWTSGGLSGNEYDLGDMEQVEEEIIPITRQEQPEPPKPPEPPKVTELLLIVDDDMDLDDELQLEDFEIDQDSELQIMEFTEEEEEEAEIFFIVEDMPGFGGEGQDGFRKYIMKNLKYPEIAAENGISGRVFVRFVVEANGSVSNVNIVRGVDPALDAEAVRVVKSSPKWTPGKQRGKPVRVSFTFPINFVLQ